MTTKQIYFARVPPRMPISIGELEEQCIIWMRNLTYGMFLRPTKPEFINWLKNDRMLIELPSDELIATWFEKWTPNYLAQYSYENDAVNKREEN